MIIEDIIHFDGLVNVTVVAAVGFQMETTHFRGPKPYTPGADFSLWRRRFV